MNRRTFLAAAAAAPLAAKLPHVAEPRTTPDLGRSYVSMDLDERASRTCATIENRFTGAQCTLIISGRVVSAFTLGEFTR